MMGEGFTERTNVKKARPLYKNHIQTKISYNNNYYYDLSKVDSIKKVDLANEYGVDGLYLVEFISSKNSKTCSRYL